MSSIKSEILDTINTISRQRPRQMLQTGLNFGMVIVSALFIWKMCIILSGSEAPIVVVLTGSMEPSFKRGDLLFLTNNIWTKEEHGKYNVGDIVVYKVPHQAIPIVHRAHRVHEVLGRSYEAEEYKRHNRTLLLTKGDNNPVDDLWIYRGPRYLKGEQVIGKVRAYLPHVGIATILLTDYPELKWAMIGVVLFFVLINRE